MRRVEGVVADRYDSCMNVGVQQLRSRLGHYLRLVRAGERIVVCVRGIPVAELIASPGRPKRKKNSNAARTALEKLAAQGIVTLGRRRVRRRPFRPVRIRGDKLVSQMVIEDRR